MKQTLKIFVISCFFHIQRIIGIGLILTSWYVKNRPFQGVFLRNEDNLQNAILLDTINYFIWIPFKSIST